MVRANLIKLKSCQIVIEPLMPSWNGRTKKSVKFFEQIFAPHARNYVTLKKSSRARVQQRVTDCMPGYSCVGLNLSPRR